MLSSRSSSVGRRRGHYGPRLCALTSSLLLLLSVYLLYSRLSLSNPNPDPDHPSLLLDPDPDPDSHSSSSFLDQIDELDDDPTNPDQDEDEDEDEVNQTYNVPKGTSNNNNNNKYRFDHVVGVVRRTFDRRSIDLWDDYDGFADPIENVDVAFGSDDVAVDEDVRRMAAGVRSVEDALLLKGSGGSLREGWGKWFEAKSDFLRRDRMFRSNLEGLNPLNNPMLQDPDGAGGITRGDRIVMKGILHEFNKVPFLVKKSVGGEREGNGIGRVVKSLGNGGEGLGEKGRGIASVEKPILGNFLGDDVEDLSKKGRGIASVKKTLVEKSLGNGVEDLSGKGRGIASVNKPMLGKSLGNGVEDLSKKGKGIASTKKLLVVKNEEDVFKDFTKKGKGIASTKKPLVVKSLENGVEDFSKGIASTKNLLVVKSKEDVVEDFTKKGKGIASTKKLLVVKSKEDVVEDLTNKGKEVASMEKPLVIRDSTHELELKTEHESKVVEGGVEDLSKVSDSLASVKTKEMSTMKKPLVIEDSTHELRSNSEQKIKVMGNGENKLINVPKPLERRALYEDTSNLSSGRRVEDSNGNLSKHKVANVSSNNKVRSGGSRNVKVNAKIKQGLPKEVYANGKRWGYFPGLHPRLSFSKFMDAFFRKGKCSMRVFMVWNSPPWAFTVRHQRGLESLFFHHRDACLVVFSETIELNFFEGFVKEGFKVAVAMPNLDELLKDTPTSVFASVWVEWRKTTFYSTHYSELIRLAALYKYGGIYLDSDVIVLKPLSSFSNTVGLVDLQAGSSLNGAVMSFKKHSPFIMECLTEFYSTYDDTKLRWNGADLLTRVACNFSRNMDLSDDEMELNLQHSSVFFPISRGDIRRYFSAPETQIESAKQNILFAKILKESFTFHFWNSLTSALIPDPESLVAKIINQHCIHCSDVL